VPGDGACGVGRRLCASAGGRQWADGEMELPGIIPRTFLLFLRVLVDWRAGVDAQNRDWALLKPGFLCPCVGRELPTDLQ